MRLLADENVPAAVVARLKAQGHEVAVVVPGAPDPEVAVLAATERRILITQDKNLANILEYPPSASAGIVLLRIHPPILENIGKALDRLFEAFPSGDRLSGKLFVLGREGIRSR